jgi:hypothetical protein
LSSTTDTGTMKCRNSLKFLINASISQSWNAEWRSSANGSATRLFFPTIASSNTNTSLFPSSNYALLQLISGHCTLNNRQHRFSFSATPACKCGNANETTTHFLFEYTLFARLRLLLNELVEANKGCWPPPLLEFPTSTKLWKSLITYIFATKRLELKRAVRTFSVVLPRGSVWIHLKFSAANSTWPTSVIPAIAPMPEFFP